jgi:hypothetical protein
MVRDPIYITFIIYLFHELLSKELTEAHTKLGPELILIVYLSFLFILIVINYSTKQAINRFKKTTLYKKIIDTFGLKKNSQYPKVIHIFIFSILITGVCYKIVGITTEFRNAEYIALLAVLVALGHLSELAKTNIAVKSSIEEIEELRKDMSLSAYVGRAYTYYGGAQKRILSCTRYWTIDQEWIIKYYTNLLWQSRREPVNPNDIPMALKKYLEDSTIATNILSMNMNANKVKFIGPVNIKSIDGLTVLPGVLWRMLFITAVKTFYLNNRTHQAITLECCSYPMEFNFIIVDNKVLMETKKYIFTQYGDLKEYGVDLGENKELADFLETDFEYFAINNPASRAIESIIEVALQNMGLPSNSEFHGQLARELVDRIYSNNKEIHYANIASYGEAQVAIDRLRIQYNVKSDDEVRNIIGGLLWDYIYYVGKDKFRMKG